MFEASRDDNKITLIEKIEKVREKRNQSFRMCVKDQDSSDIFNSVGRSVLDLYPVDIEFLFAMY